MKKILLFLMAFSFAFVVQAQKTDVSFAKQLVSKNSAAIGMSEADLKDYIVDHAYNNDGTQLVYLQQAYKGLPVLNQMRVLAFRNDALVSNSGAFIPGIDKLANASTPALTAAAAVNAAFNNAKVRIVPLGNPVVIETGTKLNFGKTTGVTEDVKAELMWVPAENNGVTSVRLAWQVQVAPANSTDWWLIHVDAANGTIISKFNLTVNDSWEKTTGPGLLKARPAGAANTLGGFSLTGSSQQILSPDLVGTANYLVSPYPAESPKHPGGAAAIRTNPWTAAPGNASSLGWQNDGTTDYIISRGNNVWATEDRTGTNNGGTVTPTGLPATSTTSPDPLNFNFPPNYTVDPTTPAFQQFAITNLFYWNNIMHDMSYQYGFTEPARNFQANNQGRGGAQGDYVIAIAQSAAGTNNANFATPADGGRPRMRMYLFDPVSSTTLHVNTPASIAGDYLAVESNFSPNNLLANVGPVTGQVAYYDDGTLTHEACSGAPVNSVAGKIALIDRGNCNFTVKVLNAQAAGAIAVVVINNVAGAPIIMGGGPDPSITIPAVMVSQANGALLVAQVNNNLNVTLDGSSSPNIDGDLDAGVMCHEFTHGISNRLTGNGSTCLQNAEQGGEGWSDYVGLMMTTNWATATTGDGPLSRPIGNYVIYNSAVGAGIRNYPYSTNLTINPLTYANMGTGVIGTEVHNIGEIWCMALWEMTWAIIQAENSINTNLYNYSPTGTGGNSIAYKLVLEGMKLQPCSPGFIDGRNAILAADRNLYAGRHACAIWTAFAKRGMGFGSAQGSSNSATDQTSTTTMPPAPTITAGTGQPSPVTVAAGANATFTANAGSDVNLIYRWQVSTNGGTTWTDVVPAVITPTLTLTAVTASMNGYLYRAVISIGCAATTSNPALLTVTGGSTVPAITLTSAAGTPTQTVCINTAITPITYSTSNGVTGASAANLPAGVTGVYSGGTNGTFTISGTPTAAGTFTYTVTTTGGGNAATATGSITVNPNVTLTLTSAGSTTVQTVTVNTPIAPITYNSGGGATGVTVTGLPAGVTGVYSGGTNGTFTISGTPTITGTFPYTVTTAGGCATQTLTGVITVNAVPVGPAITLSSAAGSNTQTVCINAPITSITYTTAGGVTGATTTNLPAGVTGVYSGGTNGTFTISGTPTTAGVFNYTVTTTGGGGTATSGGTITVNAASTITLSSAAGTNNQTLCANTPITNITYTTTGGVTGATVGGLPAGVTGTFTGSTLTISGTPTATGTFTYNISTTGGCGTVTATGTITVNPGASVTLTSAAGTNNQTRCINTAITPITYSTAGGVTNVTVAGLPAGVTGTYSGGNNGTFTISGTPTAAGTFNYIVTTTGGCASVTATGSIIVNPNATITLSSAAGTNGQTVCAATAITPITYTTGAGVTGATVTGLPAGVTGTFAGSTLTISGTPTTAGPYTYNISTTSACGTATATGTITVSASSTITLSSATGTNNQTICNSTPLTPITYTTGSGATGAIVTGLPAGVTGTYAGGVFTITGTPTAAGTFTYTVTTTGGCGTATATGTITTGGAPVITAQPVNITSCSTTATFSVTATGAGLTYQWQVSTNGGATYTNIAGQTGSTLTLTGLTAAQAAYRYRVVITGGCGSATSNSVTAQVGTPPVVVLTASPSTVYSPGVNGGLFVTVSPVGNYVYQWKRDGQILPILGSSVTAANGLLYSFGTYQVTVFDVNTGCSGVSNSVTITDNVAKRDVLFISPNPTRNVVRVSYYSGTTDAQVRSINVYDNKGARVMIKDFSVTGNYGVMEVDLSKMVNSTYTIILRDASGKKIASGNVIKY